MRVCARPPSAAGENQKDGLETETASWMAANGSDDGFFEVPGTNGGLLKKIVRQASQAAHCMAPRGAGC